ncbi:MAG TPA: DUF2341 domain-containing protein [Candidatus Acidoferrum sp.]|nr:DUF2341 domain-containing protein [Candidatus Acidoferrum sp.]
MRNKTLIHAAFTSLVLLGGTAARAQTYSNAVMALNPAAYWPLSENVATPGLYVATNSGTLGATGNGYYETWYQPFGGTALLPTNVIQHVPGITADGDMAMQQSLIGQHVVIPRVLNGVSNAAITITPPFSIEVWVYPTNGSAVGGIKPLVSEGFVNALNGPGLGNQAVSQGVTVGSYNNIIYFSTFNGAGTKSEIDTAAYAANQWHHIVGTFDGTTMKMYNNGLLVGTKVPPADALGHTYAADLVTPLLIGSGGNQNSVFGGTIDEVAIYTNVLAATDVTNHFQTAYGTNATYGSNYRNAVLANNPTIYLRLDEPAYSGAPALSTCPVANNYGSLGSTANGYYQPGTTPGVAGPGYPGLSGATAVALNGFNAGVDVGLGSVPAVLNPTANQPLTVMTWFRANPADCVGRFQEILGHSDLGWRLAYDYNAGNRFNPGNGPELLFSSVAEEVNTGFFLNDGKWHFVAGVSDGTNNFLYLDGLLAKSGTNVASIIGTNSDVILGGDPQYTPPALGPGGSRYFDGSIAQAAFFTNALSGTQIQQIYSAAGVPPLVRVQPFSQGALVGQAVTLGATISGSTPFTYQWYRNGSMMSGQTSATLTFNPIATGNAGSYYLAVTNAYGGTVSATATIAVHTATTYGSAVQALNPVGYWPLDETAQPPAGAYIANNLGTAGAAANGYYQTFFQKYTVGITNLYYQTNNVSHTAGAIGDGDTALYCQRSAAGAGSYVVFPRFTNGVANSALTLTPPFSIEFWVNPSGVTASVMPIVNEGREPVLDPRNGYTTLNWDGFSIGQYGGNAFFATYNGSGADATKQELDTAITTNVWQHMVVTFDGVNQAWYRNGSPAGSRAISASATNAFGQLYMPDVVSPLLIGTGSTLSAGNGATEYAGGIDEVAIYTNILDPGTISAHYSAASASDATYKNTVIGDNPLIYVRLGEPAFNSYPSPSSYPVANNYGSAGAAGNGAYQPGTVPGVPGPSFTGFGGSHAVAINGYSGGVDVGGGYVPAALNPTGTQPISLTAWFQGNPADAPARFQAVASHGNNGPRLVVDNIAAGPRWNPGASPEVQFVSTSDVLTNNALVNDGAWHFMAGVSDGSSATLYVDGVPVRTNTGVGALAGATYDFLLGGDPDNITPVYNSSGTAIRYFDGQIAQVAFFTNALTGAQVQQLYSAAGVPPYIASQPPASVAANAGQVVAIPITVKGSPTLAYQWYKSNGSAVSGQTTAALTFNPVQLANAGSYYAVVTNTYGRATSSIVALSVTGPPVVAQQSPTVAHVFVGTTPSLRAVVAGPMPISYQWTKDGSPITGATASSYVPDTSVTSMHTYSCVITNLYSTNTPSAFSPIAVSVLTRPTAPYPVAVLNDHPVDYFRLDESPDNGSGNNGFPAYDYAGGLNAAYTNALIAQPGSGYDSLFSPQTDPGETGATLGENNQGSYAGNVSSLLSFATSNGFSAAFSIEAWINNAYWPEASGAGIVTCGYGNGGEQFNLDLGAAGGDYRFFVRSAANPATAAAANGTNAPNDGLWHHVVGVCDQANGSVHLYVDGQLTASGTLATNSGILGWNTPLSIGCRQSGAGTGYDTQFNGNIDDVAIYNYALSPSQVLAHYVSAGVPPIITTQPSDVTVNQGSTATFTVGAIGTAPLQYQWYDNNYQPIPSGTSATLVLPDVQPSQGGGYYVIVSNTYIATPLQSASAMLNVNVGLTLVTDLQPPFYIGYANRQFTYTVGVQGTAPFTYIWTRNGVTIPSATSSNYTFSTLLGTNLYAVTVKNADNPAGVMSSTVTNVGVAAPTLNPVDYTYKARITFAGYNRPETLVNFPALVRFGTNLAGFAYGQMASPTGGDLRFTDATGTNQIPHEIDEWNTSGTSSVWVQMPTLASTNDTIWAYWGNPGATTPLSWSTDGTVWVPPFGAAGAYEVVYHLKESALPFEDSTQQHPATNGVAPAQAAGIVGTGGYFSGAAWLDEGSNNLGDSFTLSAWINLDPANPTGYGNAIQPIWANQHGGFGMPGFAMDVNIYQSYDGVIDITSGIGNSTGSEARTAAGAVSYTQWHLLESAMSQTNGGLQIYLDGQPISLASGFLQSGFTNQADVNLGRFTDGSFQMHGIVDEARIRSGISSSNWVWADYMTVAQNSTLQEYSSVFSSLVVITASVVNAQVVLTWPSGTLLQAPNVTGPWTTNNATSPYTVSPTSPREFYRVLVR